MRRISTEEVQMLAQHEDVDLAALALELMIRIAEDPYQWGQRRTLLERLEAER